MGYGIWAEQCSDDWEVVGLVMRSKATGGIATRQSKALAGRAWAHLPRRFIRCLPRLDHARAGFQCVCDLMQDVTRVPDEKRFATSLSDPVVSSFAAPPVRSICCQHGRVQLHVYRVEEALRLSSHRSI